MRYTDLLMTEAPSWSSVSLKLRLRCPKHSPLAEVQPKRLRIFAGPNGSGKSTLVANLPVKGQFSVNVFINADEIEKELKADDGVLDASKYRLSNISSQILQEHILRKGMTPLKIGSQTVSQFDVTDSRYITFKGEINSYIAADLADFIRYQLLKSGISFTFESVFSHESKLQIMTEAKQLGYRVYLYFITTEDPDINVNRVANRVAEGGHPVPEKRIRERYFKSLGLLYDAIKASDRAYLFDNSTKEYRFVAEITNGSVDTSPANGNIPNWFVKYIFERNGL